MNWDDIADSLQFEAVMDELGIDLRKHRRGWWMASCPLDSHGGPDVHPSFGVNEDELVFNCFSCGGGKLPELIIRLQHLEDDPDNPEYTAWQQALEWLVPFSDYSGEIDAAFMKTIEGHLRSAEKPPKTRRHPTLSYLSPSVIERLETAPIELLAKWKIRNQATVDHFQIKYDPDRYRIKDNKTHTGPALIIPHWFDGQLVGFQERWLGEVPKKFPKYTNSTDFPREETLFNWDRWKGFVAVIVVESTMTVVRLEELGYPSVATFGGSFSERQVQLLGTFKTVIIARDNDPTGDRSSYKLAFSLEHLTNVEMIPPVRLAKGDLADLEDDEIHDQIALSRPLTTA